MKKLFLFLLAFGTTVHSFGQITLEFTLDTCWNADRFYVTDIGNSDYKYVFLDPQTNSFSLKNLDMSPYLMNIAIPATAGSLAQGFTVAYVTKALFDCDSTTIEYVFEHTSSLSSKFSILRTDGTLIFEKDSVNGGYCFGCYRGSFDWRPVLNFPDKTRLYLQKWNPNTNTPSVFIYTLCGTLPETYVFDFSEAKQYVKIFPNPTSQQLNFELMLPDNINQYELIIMDNSSQVLRKNNASISEKYFSIDVQNYSSGTYYFSLTSKTKVLQTGKFTITK